MPDARVTLRRRSPYCTRSSVTKKVRTPGGKLIVQYVKKRGTVPKCGDTGAPLFGMAVARPKDLMRLSKTKKTVSRCYGGTLSGKAVRSRYVSCRSLPVSFSARRVM
jgi:large subunit ribosomal protein L34e